MKLKVIRKQVEEKIFNSRIIKLYELIENNKCEAEECIISAIMRSIKNINKENKGISGLAKHLFMLHNNIALYSFNNTVYFVLKENKNDLINKVLHMSKCLPVGEGIYMAEKCIELGYKVNIYDDNQFYSNLNIYDAVVMGADLICRNGIVNRAGSNKLAALCKKYHKPIYVLAGSSCIITDKRYRKIIRSGNFGELGKYYDWMPIKYITYLVSERRLYTANDLIYYLRTAI
jgi:translation initiation factor 2B subunit (eIF-2B alpha/beta/delta family)